MISFKIPNLFALCIILASCHYIMGFPADSMDPITCSNTDLQLTATCRPTLSKLTEEMKKYPKGLPDADTLKRMTVHCNEAMKCIEKAQCPAIRQKMKSFKKMCQTIEVLSGPYAQCSKRMKESPNKTECISWFYSDKSAMTTEEKCREFGKRSQCIHDDIIKTCGSEVEGNFQTELGYIMQTMGCTA